MAVRVAMLSSIAWRTPPRHYGPWEYIVSLLTEGLVKRGLDVSLFATADSITSAKLYPGAPKGYEEDPSMDPKVWECLHISELFERADGFDIIHNHFDFLPLTFARMTSTPVVTTIHGFSSPKILPVYKKYNGKAFYVAISKADKSPELDYSATVHHGIDLSQFRFRPEHGDYLLFFGRIHPEKGAKECIEIAKNTGMKLILAGIIHDRPYFETEVRPHLGDERIIYAGSAGPEKRDALLGGAYALLHPIQFDEPFGLSVVEAMACGTPVIAINRGSMPEVIDDGITGFLVRDVMEMERAIHRVKELDRMSCRTWVEEHFSAERMVDDYVRVYKEIIGRTARDDHRTWGYYEILSDSPNHKVKRVTIYPGHRLSYQRHTRRSKHLYVIDGNAVVTKNGRDITLKPGDAVDLPVESWHRIGNAGQENVVFIEIQTGD